MTAVMLTPTLIPSMPGARQSKLFAETHKSANICMAVLIAASQDFPFFNYENRPITRSFTIFLRKFNVRIFTRDITLAPLLLCAVLIRAHASVSF